MNIPESLQKRAARLEDYYRLHYEALAPLISQCFLNTIETTVKQLEDGTYFVIIGDIPAMWLRDSAAQVTGMTWSGFRPSDDSCDFGYLVPANMMAVKAMEFAEEICRSCYKDEALAAKCQTLTKEIQEGIQKYAVVEHPKHGKMYAYETDGLGNYNLMDDANSPSLLAMSGILTS